jgi:DMSO reductase anchor subunit
LPATQYKTARALPNNLLPADFYSTRPEHSHPPLVLMLTLTQLSVGAFALALWMERVHGHALGSAFAQAVSSAVMLLVALGASVFHLGRPTQAWRAVLGLRTSWLSREALVFGMFAQGLVGYCALLALDTFPVRWKPAQALLERVQPVLDVARALTPQLRGATALIGILGVYCSVMVYVATRREHWSATQTGLKFFCSTMILGAATVFTVAASSLGAPQLGAATRLPTELLDIVLAGASVKLAFELHALNLVRDLRTSAPKRMAIVMLGELRTWTLVRFATLLLAGVGWPLLLLADWLPDSLWCGSAALALPLLLVSELCERYLFFRAAPASRMPGALR